jgi:hypothetical protein
MQTMPSAMRQLEETIGKILNANRARIERAVATPTDLSTLEAGLCYPARTLGISVPAISGGDVVRVVDGRGHVRPVYRGVLAYAAARANEASAWRSFGDDAMSQLARFVFSSRTDAETRRYFEALIENQQVCGALVGADSSMNPETRWYEELVRLHALGTYACETGDAQAWGAVRRAAEFCQAEINPDHATEQPWAIFPFWAESGTRLMAEEMLHTATMRDAGRGAGQLDAIGLILLADAMWCTRRALV